MLKENSSVFSLRKGIWIILLIALTIRITALMTYGLSLTLNSDDEGYVQSAITFLESGMITYHDSNIPTVHIMPGQTVLLAAVFFMFGTGVIGIYAAKLLMISLGVISVYLVYLIGKYIVNINIGLLSATMLALYIPQALTDNLLLTETPFLVSMLSMVYFSLRLANEHKMKHFYLLMLFYLLSLLFKATIALFPIILLFYLILKKYPFRLAFKQFFIAFILLLTVLGPWWARNYVHYNEFIPLTGNSGSPLLLGTYQGYGSKYGITYDEVISNINKGNSLSTYERIELRKQAAKERINMWWKLNKETFLKTYLILKTMIQWGSAFYWIEIFNLSEQLVNKIHQIIIVTGLLSMAAIPLLKQRWREFFFLVALIAYNTILNNVFFAYDRYNQPLMFIFFILIATALYTGIKLVRPGRIQQRNRYD